MIVIDASALLELLLQGDQAQAVARRIFDADVTVHAPHLIDLEVAQVLRRLIRRGDLGEARAEEALADLADLPLIRHPHQFLLPMIWSMRDNATAYDATYLALAGVLDATLITCDRALATVPGFGDRVEVPS